MLDLLPLLSSSSSTHQQGGGGIMFWPAIIDDGSIRPFRIEIGVKIDSRGYYALVNKHFLPWLVW